MMAWGFGGLQLKMGFIVLLYHHWLAGVLSHRSSLSTTALEDRMHLVCYQWLIVCAQIVRVRVRDEYGTVL